MILTKEVKEAYRLLSDKIDLKPEVGIILGSGLDELGANLQIQESIAYKNIPHFFVSSVEGHRNTLLTGRMSGRNVLILSGRAHFYEGFEPEVITFPVRVIRALGIDRLVITSAAGGISSDLDAGDILFVNDHINLMGINPLRGLKGNVFVDMTRCYETPLFSRLKDWAGNLEIHLKEGILAAVHGPSYETPAEIRMLKTLGADAVSMSSVPEVIMAKYLGMKVVMLSLITNNASKPCGISHGEVVNVAREKAENMYAIIKKTTEIF